MEPNKKRRKSRGERVSGNAFMDTVRPAFIRWFALEKWREVEDFRTTLGFSLEQALQEAGRFPGRGPHEPLWVAQWQREVCSETREQDSGAVFAAIERAVAVALQQEEAERKSSGDRPLEEDPEYKSFVDRNLERLLRQGDLGVDQ
ncbi:MAG TPA: hypothetical protein VIH18_13510 [Candidatus Binatia bacterium]|jgi:hypothetical protein